MRHRNLLIGVVILLCGILVGRCLSPGEAIPQKPASWEYQTVQVFLNYQNVPQKEADKAMNDLAANGWEYVGIVSVRGGESQGAMAMFKRIKR